MPSALAKPWTFLTQCRISQEQKLNWSAFILLQTTVVLHQRLCFPLLSSLSSNHDKWHMNMAEESVTLPQTVLSRKTWEKRDKETKDGAGKTVKRRSLSAPSAPHWYDTLIFRAAVWRSLRGHRSIIRPVTSTLGSSAASTPYVFSGRELAHVCVCVRLKVHVFYPVCVRVSGWFSHESLITCGGM